MIRQLGPGMWLEIDAAAMARIFGSGDHMQDAAVTFADRERCVFVRAHEGKYRFGRFHFKRRSRQS